MLSYWLGVKQIVREFITSLISLNHFNRSKITYLEERPDEGFASENAFDYALLNAYYINMQKIN